MEFWDLLGFAQGASLQWNRDLGYVVINAPVDQRKNHQNELITNLLQQLLFGTPKCSVLRTYWGWVFTRTQRLDALSVRTEPRKSLKPKVYNQSLGHQTGTTSVQSPEPEREDVPSTLTSQEIKSDP